MSNARYLFDIVHFVLGEIFHPNFLFSTLCHSLDFKFDIDIIIGLKQILQRLLINLNVLDRKRILKRNMMLSLIKIFFSEQCKC